jgi:hypothetical protein
VPVNRAYLVVPADPDLRPGHRAHPAAVRRRHSGRHRVLRSGQPQHRVRPGRSGRPGPQRARHRRPPARSQTAARSASTLLLLATLLVSGWFAATGATAFAQMVS